MYRSTIIIFCLLFTATVHAAVYQWVNEQGNISYSQTRPQDKAVEVKEITTKRGGQAVTKKQQEDLQNSADELIEANTKRQEQRDKNDQEAQAKQFAKKQYDDVRKSLALLDVGGNRLNKDSEGNFSRQNEENRAKQRQQLNDFLSENC